MIIFETESLTIKTIEELDKAFFIELLSNPQIIEPIPQAKYSQEEIEDKFRENLNQGASILEYKRSVWGIFEKGNKDMIGLCMLLTNNEKDRELGYRFRAEYWGKGYATETTKGIIDYCFNTLKIDKITADVNVENKASVKVLEKFMTPVKEFYNQYGNCIDRRYELFKK